MCAGLRFDKITATASGSCSGGPVERPKTVSYVLAKKSSRACRICRRIVGGVDPDSDSEGESRPCRIRDWIEREASTW